MKYATNAGAMLEHFGISLQSEHPLMLHLPRQIENWRFPPRVPIVTDTTNFPDAVTRRFKNYRLSDLVMNRWTTDDALLLVSVAGPLVFPPLLGPTVPFECVLDELIGRYQLSAFFETSQAKGDEYGIRPRGYAEADGDILEVVRREWRRSYRRLPAVKQMLLASIMWLYAGGDNCVWLKHLHRNWPALDAVLALRADGMLSDWSSVLANYPEW